MTGEPVTRVERWERRAEVPLLLLAFAFLVAYAWPVIDESMDADLRTVLTVCSWTVWVAFAVDFLIRVGLADERSSYVRSHWYDLLLISVPLLRPLRLLRLLALARIANRSATRSLIGRVTTYVAGSAVAAVGLGAIAVLDVEQDARGSNIHQLGVALWWAASTVTTVGYGDYYPVTTEGRLIAVGLMIVGVGTVGAVTAAVAAWLVQQVELEKGQGPE